MVRERMKRAGMCVAVTISLLAALSVAVGIREGMGRESAGAVERAPYDRNVFDEMISNGAEAMGRAQHLMVGGHEALKLTCEVREGAPLAIGVIYSAEHKKLYIYGDACMPEGMQGMGYQERFEESMGAYGVTWEEIEERKDAFLCKEILGEWLSGGGSAYTKDSLGELEVVDYLMPYGYCGTDGSEWRRETEAIDEGHKGALGSRIKTTVWENGQGLFYRQTQRSRDYGYQDIVERIEADMGGFNTVSERITVEWKEDKGNEEDRDWEYYNSYDNLWGLFGEEKYLYDLAEWMKTSGKVSGNLTKLSYTREEGEVKTQEILEQYPLWTLRYILADTDFYIEGDELHIRLPYYDSEAEEPGWVENGKGKIWQGWVTVKISDIEVPIQEYGTWGLE